MAAEEPPTKKAKTDEDGAAAKEAELPQEVEADAPNDSRPKLKDPVVFHTEDTTMNVMPSANGHLLLPLADGGLQYLLCGARASVGITAGRVFFEARVVEQVSLVEESTAKTRAPQPKCQLRVGVSTSGSSLLMGDASGCCFFDTEGNFVRAGQRSKVAERCGAGDIVAVVLNLDAGSPNKNTVSLFKNGARASQPQALPEELVGKALFPTLTFKSVTVQYNFGPTPLAALPFKCKMVTDSAAKDVKAASAATPSKGSKPEVLFPVALPDEGGFDWLDDFIAKNPHYTELSDRSILRWIEQSGMVRQKAKVVTSRDKPEMGIGIESIDDHSIRRQLQAFAPLQKRSYVVMELKSNLIKHEREAAMAKWPVHTFKRSATVLVGSPSDEFKRKSQEKNLKLKQAAADVEFRAKHQAEKQKREAAQAAKKKEKEKKRMLKDQKKRQEALKKKLVEEKKKREALAKAAKGEAVEEEAAEEKEEPAEEKESEPESEDVDMEEEVAEVEPPKVELTEEEKKSCFVKDPIPDMSTFVHNTNFMKFSTTEKDEGWDEIRCEWNKDDQAKEYVRAWVQDRKCSTRVEDLQPSEWFAEKYKEYQRNLQAWHSKQTQYKAALQQKAAMKAAAKEMKKKKAEAEKNAREKRAKERAARIAVKAVVHKKAVEAALAAGTEPPEEEQEEPEDEEPEAPAEVEAEADEDDGRVDWATIDPFGVDNILDVGGGEPLFQQFAFEDWTMMSLRFELYLLANAFRRDVKDPDRIGMHVDHLPFYYQKYYKKALSFKYFGADSVPELLQMVRECVVISRKSKVVEPMIPDDLDSMGLFVMITEDGRRERQRRLDLGDESARLKFASSSTPASQAATTATSQVRPQVFTTGRPTQAAAQAPGANATPRPSPAAWGMQQAAPRPGFPQRLGFPGVAGARPMMQSAQWRPGISPMGPMGAMGPMGW